VAAVPTSFTYGTDPSQQANEFNTMNQSGTSIYYGVGERKGINGMPFVSANDPRVPTVYLQGRANNPNDSLFDQQKYLSPNTPVIVASGIEARLIEAEAALHQPNPGQMVSILNTLRATVGLSDLAVPPTVDAQVDLLYRERAFWLFLTGRRLGDMRRLIKNYGRAANTVFPTGAYPTLDLSYGTATSFPFTKLVQGQYNPHITTGCAAE